MKRIRGRSKPSLILVVVVVLRRRPFSRWHERNIEGLLHSPLPSIGANWLDPPTEDENDDDDEDDWRT
jgi:hypothetical protein